MGLVKAIRSGKASTRWLLLPILVLATLLTGCTHYVDEIPLESDSRSAVGRTYAVYGSRTVGQTFVCHHAGLDGISVLLSVQAEAGDILLHLRESADSLSDIATVSIPSLPGSAPSQTASTFHHFPLPLQDDVNGKSFFVLIESPDTDAEHALVVPYSSTSLPHHALYLDGAPATGHLSFRLQYNNLSIAKDVAKRVLFSGARVFWLLFLSALLYLLPGGLLVAWLVRRGCWLERTIVATGLSTAINALLVYATMTGLRLNSTTVIGFLVLCGAGIAIRWVFDRRPGARPEPFDSTQDVPVKGQPHAKLSLSGVWGYLRRDLSPVALLATFALVLGVRLFVVRDLVAPMWGDGYQHTMIAQLMVDNGGLFDSWEPYAPLTTFTYHFGFHANVALFHWLSGHSVIRSVIWVGQILNALAALVLYPLALRVSGGNRWAGVGAVMIIGLLSPMPMFYVNWGRYTQLAGQVILPVAMWLTWLITERSFDGSTKASTERPLAKVCTEDESGRYAHHSHWQLLAVTTMTVVGLGITHYRVILMYCAFVAALGVFTLLRNWGRWRHIGRVASRLAVVGTLAVLIFAPWGANTFRAQIPKAAEFLILEGSQSAFHRREYNAISNIHSYVPLELLILGVGGLAWQVSKRKHAGWVMVLWIAGLLILANPYLLHLPGTGIVNNFAVFIMFHIPVGVLAGLLVGEALTWLERWPRRSGLVLMIAVIVLGAGWGAVQRVKDLDRGFALVTDADMKAMAWIQENVPTNARFLVNGFVAYGGTAVVGADAGWWIPLLAKRDNTVPPLTYTCEAMTDSGDWQQLKDDLLYIKETSPTVAETVRFLQSRGITHLYVGRGQGKVGNPGEPLLEPEALLGDPAYRLVYDRDGVQIFELVLSPARSGGEG